MAETLYTFAHSSSTGRATLAGPWAPLQTVTRYERFASMNLLFALFLGGLYLTSWYSYILFHSLVELVSISIAFTIFIISWNARKIQENNYLLFVGTAYLFIGSLDLLHTLAYKGMGVFQGFDANLPTQLWISGRYLAALSFLAAPIFLRRKFPIVGGICGFLIVMVFLCLSLFYWRNFPDCYVEGIGLTPFKKISEYVICTIFVASGMLLYRVREMFERRILLLLLAALGVTIISELFFTIYLSVYGIWNLLGHLLKLVAYFLVYRAIVVTSFVSPYELLCRDLKKSEKSLRDSREYLKTLLGNMPGMAYRAACAQGLEMEFISEGCHELTGFRPDKLLRDETSYHEGVIHPEDREQVRSDITAAIAEGNSFRLEYRIITASGKPKWVLDKGCARRCADKNRKTLEGFVTDITEVKTAELSTARLAAIVESTDDGVVGWNLSGTITSWNKAAERIYGYSAAEMIGSTGKILLPPGCEDELNRLLDQGRDGNVLGNYETERIRMDGTRIYVSLTISPVREAGGSIVGLSTIVRDISSRRKLEKERDQVIAQLQDALSQVNILSGLLPICSSCKKIRDDRGYWNQLEAFISEHSDVVFSHGICPECAAKMYEELMRMRESTTKET